MKRRWLIARLVAWKYFWFHPLASLYRAGLIEWEAFEEAAMSPLRRMH